ncbi:uncharacterized protein RAG0_11354 [Rhynchosporium agropyri]|uniref:Uncharacterized protein n=1 Tax=Rhynchosporium agropyri TaxID=914238 RepID=A0A1E1L3P0_9HELO|nr:uncharacterized protein RAG0_11354 [Rhynchosporium agropyri]
MYLTPSAMCPPIQSSPWTIMRNERATMFSQHVLARKRGVTFSKGGDVGVRELPYEEEEYDLKIGTLA